MGLSISICDVNRQDLMDYGCSYVCDELFVELALENAEKHWVSEYDGEAMFRPRDYIGLRAAMEARRSELQDHHFETLDFMQAHPDAWLYPSW